MKPSWTRLRLGAGALAAAVACGPIAGTPPRAAAPMNACADQSCDAYAPGPRSAATCRSGRCELPGRPEFPFTIVVAVPDTSYFAPGSTFAIPSDDFFSRSPTGPTRCPPPNCLPLPDLGQASGGYRVTPETASLLGVGFPGVTSLPVRVTFVPLLGASGVEARETGLPVDVLFTASLLAKASPDQESERVVTYARPLPAGRYMRFSYPEPPFDEFFPPAINVVRVAGQFTDDFALGAAKSPLDDAAGETRRAFVRRAEGLDGWHVWLADATSGRRISSLRSLHGRETEARLDTVGQSQETTPAIRDNVDVIVAPPEEWIGVPRLQSALLGGQGLRCERAAARCPLDYPALPLPAAFTGLVASATNGSLTGIAGRLSFRSTSILQSDGSAQPLLRYETTVSTDESGRFATVLPPGSYDVTIEPAEGTGFGKTRRKVATRPGYSAVFEPPRRTLASGRVVLSDGRPLAQATVLATPSADAPDVVPRPVRTRTADDGTFQVELDQGKYDVTVDPQPGTGFPRVVTVREITAKEEDLGTLTVPAPMRLAFTIRDPSQNSNPIARAIVRIFAEPVGGGAALEVGMAMTDRLGACEILLAQQPR